MKIVVDTNVFVSASLVAGSPPARIIDAWQEEGKYQLVVSPAILAELNEVLFYPKIRQISRWTKEEVEALLKALERLAIQVPGKLSIKVIEADPDDDKFLIAAIEAKADYIISGDSHLKSLKDLSRD
ncbi:putative toxin-antitoxin system toxin component, PIN family [Candidatus Acetothermia bacterium]|nr:putative toxin-antitoxin system toxin component, PIN family [Candidatus Acetothermia bacterium]